MPFTINGFGTTICGGRGHISWEGGNWWQQWVSGDYDGVACVCVLFLPVLPYSAVHVFSRSSQGMGERFMQLPLRWSVALVIRAFLYRWLVAIFLVGILVAITGFTAERQRGQELRLTLVAVGSVLISGGGVGWWLLHRTDRRNHDLRRVMIATPYGSSDPATWTDNLLKATNPPVVMFGTATFREAAEKALDVGEFGRAMLAARYCAALEDVQAGESLTDDILHDPEVAAALPIVHRDPMQWKEHFGKETDPVPGPAVDSATNPSSAPADDRIKPAPDGSR